MKKSLILILTLLFVFSCASQKTQKRRRKTYSSEVQSSFENIEKDKALEKYKKLRWSNWNRYSGRKNSKKTRKRKKAFKPFSIRPKPVTPPRRRVVKKVPKPKPTPPLLTDAQIEELTVETNQYLNFYCMKNRKSSKFDSKDECKEYSEKVFKICKQKNQDYMGKKVVRCVRRQLGF